jgi:hypothetical protein
MRHCRPLPRRCLARIARNALPLVTLVATVITLVAALLCPALPQASAADRPTQSEVEAAYLYNFGKFVHWPANEQTRPLNICVLGKDPFGGMLDKIVANEKIDGRALAVDRIQRTSQASDCSILYIAASESPRLERDLTEVATHPLMTVSDIDGFAERGGMIQFVLENDRVRFEVNLNATQKAGLTLSSQLLKVAVRVIGAPAGGAPQ